MSLSLRSFHLFFVAASVLLSAWVGVWGVQNGDLTLGLLFVALGVVLLVYGLRVRKKLRELAPEDDD